MVFSTMWFVEYQYISQVGYNCSETYDYESEYNVRFISVLPHFAYQSRKAIRGIFIVTFTNLINTVLPLDHLTM